MKRAQMKLIAFGHPPGVHAAAWRMPDAPQSTASVFANYVLSARIAERGKMHALFFEDSAAVPGATAMTQGDLSWTSAARGATLDPKALLPALAMVTDNLGLIATATTTYNDPYTIARLFASMDHISNGRIGWNLVTSQVEDEAWNFGLEQHPDHADRYERALEFFTVVDGLWSSWDADAFLEDKGAGVYFDRAKMHYLNHSGQHFKVRGPLNVAASPQGRPVVAQAGSSEAGRTIAARTADLIFTAQVELEQARQFYEDMKSRLVNNGRSEDDALVMPGIVPLVGATDEEAQARFEALQLLVTDDVALRMLSRHTGGVDLRHYPLDGPLPPLPQSNSARGRQQLLLDLAAKGLSIREIGRRFAAGTGHRYVVGSARTVADALEDWFAGGAADGFVIMPPYLHGPLEDFVDLVIPELRRRGLFRHDFEGATLRENLGLPARTARSRIL
jgi:FMN-dependent oxidoreductase (nitrilotriacetate monooxygenase family)